MPFEMLNIVGDAIESIGKQIKDLAQKLDVIIEAQIITLEDHQKMMLDYIEFSKGLPPSDSVKMLDNTIKNKADWMKKTEVRLQEIEKILAALKS